MKIACPDCGVVKELRDDAMAESCSYRCVCWAMVTVHLDHGRVWGVEQDRGHLRLVTERGEVMDDNIEISNARISGTTLGVEDHEIFTCMLSLEMGGSGIGFGGYAFCEYSKEDKERHGSDFGAESILQILKVVGVKRWEDLKGQHVRVKISGGWGGKAVAIGHIIEDKWFDFEELAKKMQLQK